LWPQCLHAGRRRMPRPRRGRAGRRLRARLRARGRDGCAARKASVRRREQGEQPPPRAAETCLLPAPLLPVEAGEAVAAPYASTHQQRLRQDAVLAARRLRTQRVSAPLAAARQEKRTARAGTWSWPACAGSAAVEASFPIAGPARPRVSRRHHRRAEFQYGSEPPCTVMAGIPPDCGQAEFFAVPLHTHFWWILKKKTAIANRHADPHPALEHDGGAAGVCGAAAFHARGDPDQRHLRAFPTPPAAPPPACAPSHWSRARGRSRARRGSRAAALTLPAARARAELDAGLGPHEHVEPHRLPRGAYPG